MGLAYKRFPAGGFRSWDAVLGEVATFASSLRRDQLVSISQTEIVIIVWYWDAPADLGERQVPAADGGKGTP